MKVISPYDKKVYKKIRDNVDAFLEEQSAKHDCETIKVLDIAPQVHKGAKVFFKKAIVLSADINEDYNPDYIIDICGNNEDIINSLTFDVIVCTEVLEHTLNPFAAVLEMYRLLKWKGFLLLSTPFDFRIHGPLPDCWRFTEHGIRVLLKEFEIVEINALENKDRFLMPFHYTTVAKKESKCQK